MCLHVHAHACTWTYHADAWLVCVYSAVGQLVKFTRLWVKSWQLGGGERLQSWIELVDVCLSLCTLVILWQGGLGLRHTLIQLGRPNVVGWLLPASAQVSLFLLPPPLLADSSIIIKAWPNGAVCGVSMARSKWTFCSMCSCILFYIRNIPLHMSVVLFFVMAVCWPDSCLLLHFSVCCHVSFLFWW